MVVLELLSAVLVLIFIFLPVILSKNGGPGEAAPYWRRIAGSYWFGGPFIILLLFGSFSITGAASWFTVIAMALAASAGLSMLADLMKKMNMKRQHG
ncbi:hypothetical protein CR205_00430 [Alteribacter lacisalsi]|uniref:Uncharacterized protein n=1 Tax=Alteribacter lacisalsi TaxID=2045244 RepID=A0A2W0HJX2_9BACI|nr:hypothetical protein [Alteribacter lacisalsi]PYZ97109.1 hypothetical protein CR205_00430 [Alteribacter lacisalsi]